MKYEFKCASHYSDSFVWYCTLNKSQAKAFLLRANFNPKLPALGYETVLRKHGNNSGFLVNSCNTHFEIRVVGSDPNHYIKDFLGEFENV